MKENKSLQPRTPFRQKIILVLFGLSLFFVLLEVSLRLGGFILLSFQEHRNTLSIRQKDAYRIMCLGESTTIVDGKDAYPYQLEEILNQKNIGIKFRIVNKGIAGKNTSYIVNNLKANLDKYKPNMVITMMGVNDNSASITYEKTTTDKTPAFFESLKLFKFARFFSIYILNKIKQARIEKAIRTHEEFVNLAKVNSYQGDYINAEGYLKKAVEINPQNDQAYLNLGLVYRDRGDFDKAEGYLKKAAEINPGNQTAYCYLGILCELSLKDYQKAEEYFKMMDSRDPERYIKLGWLSVASGANGKTAEIIQELTELNLENTCLYGLLATLYGEMGKYDLAEEYYKKANEARLKYCNSVTRNNYLQLKKILYEKGIKFICVQYPVRSIEPLKKMFAGQQDIVFVDNEKVFKEKLKKGTYKDYFIDFFGGDFGHCTRKGNRLLAENIANVILREVFHK